MFLIHDDEKDGSRQIWASVENYGQGRVWEFLVYGITRDPRSCPSLAMACELLDVDPRPILELCPSLGDKPLPLRLN